MGFLPMTLSAFSSPEIHSTDILIVGGGIAGASAAFELSAFASVILLEQEKQCGYHATGRSAASFTENYGNTVIRRLAMASRAFLEQPPQGFCEHPLMMPRGMITIAREDQLGLLEEELDRARQLVPTIRRMNPLSAVERVSVLRPDYVAAAIVEPDSREIDVNGLHQGFLRGARKRGARVLTGIRAQSISRQRGNWTVVAGNERYAAPILVNAAGAWADRVAVIAGVEPVGLTPLRRTAFNIPVPMGVSISGWPLVNDVGGEFYFKPDAGQIFVSPADATPSDPVDAYADDMDVAVGVDRLEKATTLKVDRVTHSWAGLRTFAADGSPVVGEDLAAEGFFWLAGQGGYGIKTSPALSRACAELICFRRLPADIETLGIRLDDLSPGRFKRSSTSEINKTGIARMTIERLENGTRFCRALKHNGTLYLSGMTADDLSGDTTAQTRDILAKIDGYLAKAGTGKTKVLSAVIWLRDIADFEKMNAAWDAWVDKSAMPVRATVEARLAGDDYRVEIMMIAAV